MEARREWCHIFQVLEENTYQQRIVFLGQIYFRKKGDIARWRETKGITFQMTYLKRMARGISLKKKEIIKEGILEHQKGREQK